jgi:4a-hydroxytetrahydrobiopterin dehydratase
MPTTSQSFSQEVCEACIMGAPTVSDAEAVELLKLIPSWSIKIHEGVPQLTRVFSFSDFRKALNFTNQVGELAELSQHHPAILLEWGKVIVTWWTHKIEGLHKNDFIMAARTDEAFNN